MKAALAGFWHRSRVSLIVAAVLAIGVIIFGLHDVGIILGILGAMVINIEISRRWRKTRSFIILFFASFFGIIFLAFLDVAVIKNFILHLDGAGETTTGYDIFNQIVSLIILFFDTAGLITGFFGTIIVGIWRLVALISKRKASSHT
jgi:hypothetical protein